MNADPVRDVDVVRNHWWPRPGWRPGRVMYAWHLTFEDAPGLARLVAHYQDALRGQAGLNLVPQKWLHLTIQGVGYVDEVPLPKISSVAEYVARLVEPLRPFTLHFRRAYVDHEAIKLAPRPTAPLIELRQKIREGIASATGTTADQVPIAGEQTSGFRPHVSIGYVNTPGPAAPYVEHRSKVEADSTSVNVQEVRLIEQLRVLDPEWVYRWINHSTVTLRGRD